MVRPAMVMSTPRSLSLAITTRCNLRCSYCSHFASAGDVARDLSTREWLTFFEEMHDCRVMKVIFSGGEPFIRDDIRELILGVVSRGMRFTILSNGTLVDEDIARFLADQGRCEAVQVSIDGIDAESHDTFRGAGTLEAALRGLRHLRDARLPTVVRVTIHRKNYDRLDRVAQMLLDEVGLPSFSTNSASYMGLCRQNETMVGLTPGELSDAMTHIERLNQRYPGRITALAGVVANLRNWRQMERALKAGSPGIPGCGFLRSCGGIFEKLDVRADGVMVPCSQLSHIELGQVNRDSLRDVWQWHPQLVRLRARRRIPLSEVEFCHGCPYIPYCRGGCPALAYTYVGDDSRPAPDSCYRHFLEQGGRLPPGEWSDGAAPGVC